MGDTRPPPYRRLHEIENIRLWAAQAAATPPEIWGSALAGEALGNIMILLTALDAVMSLPDIRALVYESVKDL